MRKIAQYVPVAMRASIAFCLLVGGVVASFPAPAQNGDVGASKLPAPGDLGVRKGEATPTLKPEDAAAIWKSHARLSQLRADLLAAMGPCVSAMKPQEDALGKAQQENEVLLKRVLASYPGYRLSQDKVTEELTLIPAPPTVAQKAEAKQ